MQEKSKKDVLIGHEGEVLNLLSSYAKALTLLEEYDSGKIKDTNGEESNYALNYESCVQVINELKLALSEKGEAGDLFGTERQKSFEGIIKNLYQTYDNRNLYQSVGDRAANLLYLVIKDHPFLDGNKRTASFLFVYYLDKTNSLYRKTGEKKINDNALTALALLIAESNPTEKEIMVKITKSLIAN